uniref:Magnesium transporter n=1 Tax=Picea sitchensis TaxID=3332 RepID=B8LQE7_PICSI|nr:unknown [Picea sitchensis]
MGELDSSSTSLRPQPSLRRAVVSKKGIGVRAWLLIDGHGGTQVVEAGKHDIMRRTGLPARDLRVLDPLLSYPSTILGRDTAIVINLEHIKAIITAHEVLLLNSSDPAVAPFIVNLQRRLLNAHSQVPGKGEGGHSDYDMEFGSMVMLAGQALESTRNKEEEHLYRRNSPHKPSFLDVFPDLSSSQAEGKRSQLSGSASQLGPASLPFEFLALETCLEAACSYLEVETETLEHEAYPALDELTVKCSTLNLERVRQIKSRLVAISGRVQAVRDELEQLLDDDRDMSEMYLTDKLMRHQLEELASPVHSTSVDEASFPLGANKRKSDDEEESYSFHSQGGSTGICNLQSRFSRSSSTNTSVATSKSHDVEDLEMLLEAYFVQTDSTLNKLFTLREYVEDTEDYINIMLDDKQNHLLQMGVMMTTGTLVMSAFLVVTGIFGMNIQISLFDDGGLPQFLWVVGGTGSCIILAYILVIAWCKHKRLLE